MSSRSTDSGRAGTPLGPAELARYERQLRLPEIGAEGQARIRSGRVLVVGGGGLGSPASIYLAAAGVGSLTLLDHDTVESSNLHRQILFDDRHVGRGKSEIARERLANVNPHVEISAHDVRLDADNARDWIERHDVVVDGSDNFATRFALSDAAAELRTPLVSGSLERFRAQISVFCAGDGPCYRCLYREPPPPGEAPSCSEAGVIGVLPGIVGTLQAAETLKLLSGAGRPLVGRLLLLDLLDVSFREFAVKRDASCPACAGAGRGERPRGATRNSPPPRAPETPMEIDATELAAELDAKRVALVDVRSDAEWEAGRIAGALHIPLPQLSARIDELDGERDWVVYCHIGQRSFIAAQMMRAAGHSGARSLSGGIVAWSRVGAIES